MTENIIAKMCEIVFDTRATEDTYTVVAFKKFFPPVGSVPAPLVAVGACGLDESQVIIKHVKIIHADITAKLGKTYCIRPTELYLTANPMFQIFTLALCFLIVNTYVDV